MFETIKKLFKNEEEIVSKEIYYVPIPWVKITYKDGYIHHEKIKDPDILLKLKEEEKVEKDEITIEENDYKKHLNEKLPEYVELVPNNADNHSEIELHVYFKNDYLGYVIADRAKIEALDSEEETRILEIVSKKVKDHEEKLEQLRIRKEIEKEKLEFMRLRNEMLKKKLGERIEQ